MENFNDLRKITVFGRSHDAVGTVTCQGVEVFRGAFSSGNLYSFNSSIYWHGSVEIEITLDQGTLEIGCGDVTYPARINEVDGFYTFQQPIINTFYDPISKQPILAPFVIDKTLTFRHLMVNGPRYFKITIPNQIVEPGTNLFGWFERRNTVPKYLGDSIYPSDQFYLDPDIVQNKNYTVEFYYGYDPKQINFSTEEQNLIDW